MTFSGARASSWLAATLSLSIAAFAFPSVSGASDDLTGWPAVDRDCLRVHFEKKKCQYAPLDAAYKQGFTDKYLLTYAATGSFAATEFIRNMQDIQKCSPGEIERQATGENLKREARRLNLSECQRACFAVCAASAYLKYGENWKSKHGGIADIVTQKEGGCTEFSRLGQEFLSDLGIDADLAAVPNHQFISLRIGKEWFYLDPTISSPATMSCDFFRQK